MHYSLHDLVTALAVLAVACCSASCRATDRPDPVRAEPGKNGYSSFGIDLYREMIAERPGENVFISPASIGFALAMTYNGAQGPTRDAMAGVLRFPAADLAAINRTDSVLIARMNEPIEQIELSVANSLWARRGIDFKKDFLERNKRFYGAEVRPIDFDAPGAPGQINAWVAEKTRDKITEIVDEIDSSSILFLINAIYFKGAWTEEFDAKLTRDADFHLAEGMTERRAMMDRRGTYLYLRGEGFQAASLPYGDGRMSMYVFLPDDRAGLGAFIDSLTSKSWDAWMSGFAAKKGRVVLPRFTIEFKASLKRSLSKLGMGNAFDGALANFSGMLRTDGANAYIHDVLHKTYIDVNEEGTEAAAVTSVEIRLTSVMEPEEPFEMICDHPFFFAIRDNETGLILFMGSLVNPE